MVVLSVTQILLMREAELSSSNIGNGLNVIRGCHFNEAGQFYAGLFSYGIGLERLMKLIIMYSHFELYGRHPTSKEFKSYGHKLNEMMSEVKSISLRLHIDGLSKTLEDDIISEIVEQVSAFAEKSRYYNLDNL